MNRDHISRKLTGWVKMHPTLMGLAVVIGVTATANAWQSPGDGGPPNDLTNPAPSPGAAGRRAEPPSDSGDSTAESGQKLCWYKQKVSGCGNSCPFSPHDCEPQFDMPCETQSQCKRKVKERANCLDPRSKGCKAVRKRCGCGLPDMNACCMPDGSCEDMIIPECAERGGIYNFGEECGTFECSQPAACCFNDLTCRELVEPLCIDAGGDYQAGESCEGFRCPRGACCVTDSQCKVIAPKECGDSGGEYLGDDVSCRNACPCDRVRELKATCNGGGAIRIVVKFKNEGSDGDLIVVGIGQRLRIEMRVRGKVARHSVCCFGGAQTVRLLGPEGCNVESVANCR